MATFKVGDRVRIVGGPDLAFNHIKAGKTATLVGFGVIAWQLDIDGLGTCHPDGLLYGAESHHLAPLTPPAEDTWAADKVRELTRPKPMDVERVERERIKQDFHL